MDYIEYFNSEPATRCVIIIIVLCNYNNNYYYMKYNI